MITMEQCYSGGFIEHYVLPVIYPSGRTPRIQIILGTLVLAINAVALVLMIVASRLSTRRESFGWLAIGIATVPVVYRAAREVTGLDGKVIGLDDYGASALQEILYKEFGLTAEHLAEAVKSLL